MSDYEFDTHLVDAFVDGKLGPDAEARLADQVARILAYHWAAPNPIVAALERLRRHLGGETGLLQWLEQHRGRPRLVARLYPAIALLERFSDRPGVVAALREFRERTPTPPGLEDYLLPDTDEVTLANLAGTIELLAGDGELDRAASVALATLTMLRQMSDRAAQLDADASDLGPLTEQAMSGLADAVADQRDAAGTGADTQGPSSQPRSR
jgi:hypothetical protein